MEDWGSILTPQWAKRGGSETKIRIATTTPIAYSISHIIIMSSMMTHTRRKKMSSGRCSSKSVPKKRRRDCSMAVRCTLMDLTLGKLELKVLTDFTPDPVRWQGNKPSVKRMTRTSTFRSLRGSYVNTFSSLSLSIALRSNSFRTLSLWWWSLALTEPSRPTEPSYLLWSEPVSSTLTTCSKF